MRNLMLTLIVCGAALPALAATVTIDSGVAAHQVVQANADDTARIEAAGTWGDEGLGIVEVRLTQEEAVLRDWTEAGRAEDGAWQGDLRGVPVGGPYTIDWQVRTPDDSLSSTVRVNNVFVGDVWVLAGQSNMEGVARLEGVPEPHPQVMMYGHDERWQPAQVPVHVLAAAIDPVHGGPRTPEESAEAMARAPERDRGMGPGLFFARELTARTGRPIGLIPCAHGGTSMEEWSPVRRDAGGESLYGSMLRRFQEAGGAARGILWYQGESDTRPGQSDDYEQRFIDFIAAVREDLGEPELPFIYVQIGRFTRTPAERLWDRVQDAQVRVEEAVDNVAFTTAVDLTLDDPIHVSAEGMATLGARLATLAETLVYGGTTATGPRFASATLAETPYDTTVRVRFTGVNGTLQAPGRPYGFSISDGPEGGPAGSIYKQEIDPADPNVVVLWVRNLPDDPYLWYARGANPYVNLVDEAGLALPAFGPRPIE